MDSYRVLRQLQLGLFGLVLLAAKDGLADKVCIKRVAKRLVATREIEMLTAVGRHPGVCQLLEWFEDQGDMVLVLEYCAGDVYDLIHERDLTIDECVRLATQLGAAVAHAHAQGVYHRDIKPENILYDFDGNFKLCDWGLATSHRICDEMNVGTEKYMAPEMFDEAAGGSAGNTRYDAALADYWGVGITLLALIFGLAPFKPTTVDDANFRTFCQSPQILYDIYPSMNLTCYETFTSTIVRVAPELRDLTAFVSQFELKLAYGFTVDEYHDSYAADTNDDDVFAADMLRASTMFDRGGRQHSSFDNTLPTLILLVKLTKLWCDMDDTDDAEFHQQIDAIFKKLGGLHVRE